MRRSNLDTAHRLASGIQRLVQTLVVLAATVLQYIVIRHRPSGRLAAENFFLRKQLALFQEREIKPRRADNATRGALVWLSRAFNWRDALVVRPTTRTRCSSCISTDI